MTAAPHRRAVPRYLLLVMAAACLLAGCSAARLGEARRVLDDIDAGPGPSALKAETPAPTRGPVTFEIAGRTYGGDLYEPGQGGRAAVVLVPGVSPAGKDDPRLVAFATTLARARFRVLVPDLENLRELRVGPADARAVADSLVWMRGTVPAGRALGVVAVSYAAGPALMALLEPEAGDAADFALLIGGYYDLGAVVTFFTTGRFRETTGEPWRYRSPNAYGKWVFLESNLMRLARHDDRALLRVIKDEKIRDPDADTARWAAGLSPDGRAVYDLVTNTDPGRVPGLIAALPASLRGDFRALDPAARDLSGLHQTFFLIHGRDDPIIPETESMKLAAALGPGRARLYLLDSLDHVDPKPIGLGDKLTLLGAIYGVLTVRDDGAAGGRR